VPVESMDPSVGLVLRLSGPIADPNDDPSGDPSADPTYGGQLQDRATTWAPHEGRVQVTFTEVRGAYGDGSEFVLQSPTYRVGDLQFGPLAPDTALSARLAPAVIGLGLLEAVPEEDLLAWADPDDTDGDGISGRPNLVWDRLTASQVVGRFGWKASQPTVAQQTARALHEDLGVTSALFPEANCPAPQAECGSAPSGGEPEASAEVVDQLTLYTRTLAVPARRAPTDEEARRGERLFTDTGCAACHRPTLETGASDVSGLRAQVIHPYTDLLLHDLGPGLADRRSELAASGSEWRTAPLWGIGLAQRVTPGTGFLHDGRARTVAEAILWHGGEAEPARERFRTLSAGDRAALIAFIESL
jgi:CxxC motif-containing protein (DUF1111 family)